MVPNRIGLLAPHESTVSSVVTTIALIDGSLPNCNYQADTTFHSHEQSEYYSYANGRNKSINTSTNLACSVARWGDEPFLRKMTPNDE